MDASPANTSKDVDKAFGTNHSLDRGHGSHSHSHSHHHHHSLDRDSVNFTNNSSLSCSASTRGQFCSTNTPPSNSVVAKSRSSTSNNSLTTSNHINSSEEQLNQHRKSTVDAAEWNESTGCSRGSSDRSASRQMMKPPKDPKSTTKDPKSTNHHHHSRHKLNDEHQHHHHQHQHRKKSVGESDGGSLGGMRKISAAGSVSSVLSENSMGSYSKSRTNSNDFSHKMQAN